jgi:predicted RNase H-like HicB family nuclease
MMDIQIEPKEALTGFLEILNVGKFRLDFLVTYESGSFYIRCLDFGIMSCGETIEECMENIRESISIYLGDLPEGENLYKPSPTKYWQMFYKLREESERQREKKLSVQQKKAMQESISTQNGLVLQYA